MIQCPECRSQIPDDSAFCDQCGKELKWCPVCKRPKRGTECPVCGADLVPGRKYLIPGQGAAPVTGAGGNALSADGASVASGGASVMPGPDRASLPAALVGNGWRLPLQEGPFGRGGGIWPELATCPYVSGSHGRIEKVNQEWFIVDVGSTNGTFVNGARIQRQPLKKGDRVKIATLEFTVE